MNDSNSLPVHYCRSLIVWPLMAVLFHSIACGNEPDAAKEPAPARPPRDLLSREQWRRLEDSVDRGLAFLAKNQQGDGSFEAPARAQPGVTGLGVLAFLSRGHQPDSGTYGAALRRAIDFVLKTQQENGMFFGLPIDNHVWSDDRHKGAAYNHAIAGLMLSEVYGMTPVDKPDRMGEALRKGIRFTLGEQRRTKMAGPAHGGWRYVVMDSGAQSQSDLSVTAWQMVFLRSARNAEFDVSVEQIDAAMEFVRRSYLPDRGAFSYGHFNLRGQVTRAMVGSGIVMLSLGGEHDTPMARSAGKWILQHPFDRYNQVQFRSERYHYSAYYCSQAMFQLGGDYWSEFFPRFMQTLIDNQRRNGNWDIEGDRDGWVGNNYTTALTILALTPPFQLLPIYQR